MKPQREVDPSTVLKFLGREAAAEYLGCRHVRVEIVEADTRLVAYTVKNRIPTVHDILVIDNAIVMPDKGLTFTLGSETQDLEEEVGVMPIKPFGLPLFVHAPLNPGLRWHPDVSNPEKGVMSFPLVIRVQSRYSPVEPNVMHLERLADYENHFGSL